MCGNLDSSEPALLTRERHRRHAAGCLAALDAFLTAQVGPGAGAGARLGLGAGLHAHAHLRAPLTNCRCYNNMKGSMPIELAAEELRIASRELGRVVGAIDVEEVLDVLFRDFCIGK